MQPVHTQSNIKITIGFSRPSYFNPLSIIVRLFMWSKYSHVYVKWHSETAQTYIVYQAQGLMLHFTNFELFKRRNKVIEEIDLDADEEQYKKILKFCMQNAGVHYGILQLIGIGLKKMFWLSKNPLGDKNKTQICSEVAANVLTTLGYYFNNYDDVTPKEIHDIILSKQNHDKI